MTTTAELVKRLLDAGANSDVIALFLEAVAETQKTEAQRVGQIAASLEKHAAKELKNGVASAPHRNARCELTPE